MLVAAFDISLKGVKIVVIHAKDTFSDGHLVGDGILSKLNEVKGEAYEHEGDSGRTFEISRGRESCWFAV